MSGACSMRNATILWARKLVTLCNRVSILQFPTISRAPQACRSPVDPAQQFVPLRLHAGNNHDMQAAGVVLISRMFCCHSKTELASNLPRRICAQQQQPLQLRRPKSPCTRTRQAALELQQVSLISGLQQSSTWQRREYNAGSIHCTCVLQCTAQHQPANVLLVSRKGSEDSITKSLQQPQQPLSKGQKLRLQQWALRVSSFA